MKELEKWEIATNELAQEFVSKYFDHPEYPNSAEWYWVGGCIGGVFYVNSYFFDLSRIVEAIKFNATFNHLTDYYDLELEQIENGKTLANFKNFVKYNITWV